MAEITINNRVTIPYRQEFTLLDTLEEAGLEVNYNCRGGFCGACKTRLKSGKLTLVQEPLLPMSDGEFLSCCSIPKSDIFIEI